MLVVKRLGAKDIMNLFCKTNTQQPNQNRLIDDPDKNKTSVKIVLMKTKENIVHMKCDQV